MLYNSHTLVVVNPHPDHIGFRIFPEEMMNLSQADYGISGEGKVGLVQLMNGR